MGKERKIGIALVSKREKGSCCRPKQQVVITGQNKTTKHKQGEQYVLGGAERKKGQALARNCLKKWRRKLSRADNIVLQRWGTGNGVGSKGYPRAAHGAA